MFDWMLPQEQTSRWTLIEACLDVYIWTVLGYVSPQIPVHDQGCNPMLPATMISRGERPPQAKQDTGVHHRSAAAGTCYDQVCAAACMFLSKGGWVAEIRAT